MSILIYSLVLLFITQPPIKEITVIFSGQKSKLVKFELQLIRDLIETHSKKNNEKFKIKYKGTLLTNRKRCSHFLSQLILHLRK